MSGSPGWKPQPTTIRDLQPGHPFEGPGKIISLLCYFYSVLDKGSFALQLKGGLVGHDCHSLSGSGRLSLGPRGHAHIARGGQLLAVGHHHRDATEQDF